MSRIDQEIRNCDPGGRPEPDAFREGVEFCCRHLEAAADRVAPDYAQRLRALAADFRAEGEKYATEAWPEYEIAEPERRRPIRMD